MTRSEWLECQGFRDHLFNRLLLLTYGIGLVLMGINADDLIAVWAMLIAGNGILLMCLGGWFYAV